MERTPTTVVGANVRAEMARRGVTQTTLAAHLSLSQAAVSARLNGHTPIDVNELHAIAALLEVPVSVLLAPEVAVPAH